MTHRRPLKKGKKACTECRQQKAKCDVYLNPDEPCTRCRKVNAECIISDPFKREHKRRRLSDLQRESEELRRKLRESQPADPHPSPIALLTAAAELGSRSDPHVASLPASSHVSPDSYPTQLLAPGSLGSATPAPAYDSNDATLPRSLNGVELTSAEIDDLFQLYFRHYAQFFPILDPHTRPNAFYAQCPFLFWSIIGVSCRVYPQNPTLLIALARSIIEMAFMSGLSSSPPWHIIQAFLLILQWPFPKGDHPDVNYTVAGMMLHIAMQNGLHIPMSSHEFSRRKMPAPSEADLLRRSELWALSVVVYHRVCMQKGQIPRINSAQDPTQRQAILDKIAPWMALKLRCQGIVGRCSEAVMENGIQAMSMDQERSLDILLRTYESQMDDLELQAVSDDERFDVFLGRMAIQGYHFYKIQTWVSSACFPRVLVTACNLIDYIQSLTDRVSSLAMIPAQMHFGLFLASTSLLRILKSPAASHGLETIRARASLFTAINLAKQMSVDSADMASKMVIVLSAIWNSNKAFRRPDGSEFTTLRIRGRLVVSPIIDAIWWWRDEYDPPSRFRSVVEPAGGCVYGHSRSNGAPETGPVAPGTDTSQQDVTGGVNQDAFLLDEQFLADFEWALTDDLLFTTESMPNYWAAGNNML
ncbi:hypothetical protein N7504_011236 [Penicillium tannophilum]|nr:hypothetical protein N7504_011236 [Penicillium tannophilum]